MSKFYENHKTHLAVISGKVKSIAPDRMSVVVQTSKYDREEKREDAFDVTIHSSTPIADSVAVGKNITACSYHDVPTDRDIALYLSSDNGAFEHGGLAVISGNVVYARYNEEKNEDGTPKMTSRRVGADGAEIPPKPRTPHFDIAVSANTPDENGGSKKVLYIVKEYPFKSGDTVDTSKIDRHKKLFANFDRETNGAYVTIATSPGAVSSVVREYNGREYVNTYSNHMGIYSLDVMYEKERTRDKSAGNAEKKEDLAPVKEDSIPPVTAAPAVEQPSGFTENEFTHDDDDIFI